MGTTKKLEGWLRMQLYRRATKLAEQTAPAADITMLAALRDFCLATVWLLLSLAITLALVCLWACQSVKDALVRARPAPEGESNESSVRSGHLPQEDTEGI